MKKDTLHKLVEALKPFAEMELRPHWSDQSILARTDYQRLKVGDFRRAREALSLLSKGGGIDAIPEPARLDPQAATPTLLSDGGRTPYPYFCSQPECVGLARCPRDPVCND